MIICNKCNSKISISSRLKSINKENLEIQCDKCKAKYGMKYYRFFFFTNTFLIFTVSPRLNALMPSTTFLASMIRSIIVVITSTFIIFFILSYFMKYEEIE